MRIPDVFNSRDEIYLVFTEKGTFSFSFYTFYRLHAMSHPLKKGDDENAKPIKKLAKPK